MTGYFQAPAIYTRPLSDDFTTDADWLIDFVNLVWKTAESPNGITLDEWQVWLLRHALETYPPGHAREGQLRYRQLLISMGRQNGKSVLGAIFGLYGLIREAGAMVVGVASTAEQARIIYDRTMLVIQKNSSLAKRFKKLTETRGIRANDGSVYEIKASKSAAIQGIPVSLGLLDECHIAKKDIWQALVNGTAARKNGIVLTVTTAGDDNSELLKELYVLAEKAAAGDQDLERFGAFIWQAPESYVPQDRKTLVEFLNQANPAMAAGRLDIDTIISDLNAMAAPDIVRYRLNRFVAAEASFLDLATWMSCKRSKEDWPTGKLVFALDRSPDWEYATFVAAIKDENGVIHTRVVSSFVKPTVDDLLQECIKLNQKKPATFIMDSFSLKKIIEALKSRRIKVTPAHQADITSASSMMFSKVMQRKMTHVGDEYLSYQLPHTVRKNVGDTFRISRASSSHYIDAVMATALAVYGAETIQDKGLQLF